MTIGATVYRIWSGDERVSNGVTCYGHGVEMSV